MPAIASRGSRHGFHSLAHAVDGIGEQSKVIDLAGDLLLLGWRDLPRAVKGKVAESWIRRVAVFVCAQTASGSNKRPSTKVSLRTRTSAK